MQCASSTANSATRTARRSPGGGAGGTGGAPTPRVRSPRPRPSPPGTVDMPPKKTAPAADTGARIPPRGPPLRAILPVHRVAVAALQALHFLGLPGDVLALVATGAHEMRLVHHAPALGDVLAELDVVLGNAHLHAVHVEHHPGLPRVLDDPGPRTAPQPLLLGPVAAGPG